MSELEVSKPTAEQAAADASRAVNYLRSHAILKSWPRLDQIADILEALTPAETEIQPTHETAAERARSNVAVVRRLLMWAYSGEPTPEAVEDAVVALDALAAALSAAQEREKALRSFTRHRAMCKTGIGGACNCGLAALAPADTEASHD